MTDEKRILKQEELANIDGGLGGEGGRWMTVTVQSSYLALRPQPVWNQYHELAQIPNGAQVFTDGQVTNGSTLNGAPCQYRWICYNGQWGWANANNLR